jgi:hypothetical protein
MAVKAVSAATEPISGRGRVTVGTDFGQPGGRMLGVSPRGATGPGRRSFVPRRRRRFARQSTVFVPAEPGPGPRPTGRLARFRPGPGRVGRDGCRAKTGLGTELRPGQVSAGTGAAAPRRPRPGRTRVARPRPATDRPADGLPPSPPTVPAIRPPGGARRTGRAGGAIGIRGRYSLGPDSSRGFSRVSTRAVGPRVRADRTRIP